MLTRLISFLKRTLGYRLVPYYPQCLNKELSSVSQVLQTPYWNMCKGGIHETLEQDFAKYVNVKHAISVNSGGMAIQLSLRALGFVPGDEVIHQVDTCCAVPFSIMNAGITPIFADIDPKTFMLDETSIRSSITSNTKAIMPNHMWGNTENMAMIQNIADEHHLTIIEDACLSLGARYNTMPVGSMGNVGIFSFGRLKPIQAGEGGMIVTNDDTLAKELRTLRHYGDQTAEYGIRDNLSLSWNGRLSEILAAVILEQLKGYPKHLKKIHENIHYFANQLSSIDGLDLHYTGEPITDSVFTQVVLKINPLHFPVSKSELMSKLKSANIHAWHGNFELLTSLSVFKHHHWKQWIHHDYQAHAASNYSSHFSHAQQFYDTSGIGIPKHVFLTKSRTRAVLNFLRTI